ncbi:hypothetical protein BDB00DRAFT_819525 [Zychaea mexicana]|uniref:uncharacterized protein n=1 Tax=Zychaea mexicana TaxID=64656 RepID=UPI0022FDD32D|nr:uncharacterized protein BDB00DRAFT_819525 [Zychaea mexicana]KAI9494289.1 hypothetical protein BDB00DRAFT_819525 [Zychaea mexicana]
MCIQKIRFFSHYIKVGRSPFFVLSLSLFFPSCSTVFLPQQQLTFGIQSFLDTRGPSSYGFFLRRFHDPRICFCLYIRPSDSDNPRYLEATKKFGKTWGGGTMMTVVTGTFATLVDAKYVQRQYNSVMLSNVKKLSISTLVL